MPVTIFEKPVGTRLLAEYMPGMAVHHRSLQLVSTQKQAWLRLYNTRIVFAFPHT